MNSVVLNKGVPDLEEDVEFDEDGNLKRGATPTILNPDDEEALEAALQVRTKHGGDVSALCMGPPTYDEVVLKTAMEEFYADYLYLLTDREFAAADTWATAITIAAAIEKMGDVDLVFAGFKAADGETGHTGPQTAWALDWNIVTHVTGIEVYPDKELLVARRSLEEKNEIEEVETSLPAVVVTDPEFESFYSKASHRLNLKDLKEETKDRAKSFDEYLTTWGHEDLNLDPDYIGLDGSPTVVDSVDPIPRKKPDREAAYIDLDNDEEAEEILDVINSTVQ